ncbi:MAG: bifunctional precorrin-2 dehydrogenase/sirohydrochlorin ferrochelatase [Firmicutes bacterium]|nr:bifunctional precorrin-2 dehydrogenase/sirohydrochlorin ferrochelatase [Bacillota bacterium]
MTSFYPIFLDVEHKLCVIVGGGKVATRKAVSLLGANAVVRVISPQVHSDLTVLAEANKLQIMARKYQDDDLAGAFLVIAATDNTALNGQVAAFCQAQRILCNVVDAPEHGNFIVPSMIVRGPLTLAISTGGMAPAATQQIRQRLQEEFDDAYGVVLATLGQVRKRIKREFDDPQQRRSIVTSMKVDDLVCLYRTGGQVAVDKKINQMLLTYKKENGI